MIISSLPARSISVNGRFLAQPVTGVQRYAHELLSALDFLRRSGALEEIPITILVPPGAKNLPSWTSFRIQQAGRFSGQLWEQIDLPVHARGSLLFTPCGGAPVVYPYHVITIHDAGPFSTPHAYTASYGTYYRWLQRILSRRALHILTVSDFSRTELIRTLKVPETRITRTWLSGEHILRCGKDDTILGRNKLIRGRYVLAVSSRNPNKNVEGLARAFQSLGLSDVTLVVAGGSNASVFGQSRSSFSGARETGTVTDPELRSLYENAGCFVFPSFYEGFGLPPLEALTIGCPVVVSRAASLPEVFGDAVTYCDPHSPNDIARQISRVMNGEHPDRGVALRHASRFTWEQCARETWSVLLNAMDH